AARDSEMLCVDLRGFDRPVEPAAVLEAFLRALGVPGGHIPLGSEARARAYRNLVGSKRMLIVLDNAASADQVRPLLADVAMIITSRHALRELDGITRVPLVEFSPEESVDLLRNAAGDQVTAEPEATAGIADICGHLPLALELAGRHI